jgi:Uncharacterised protein family (UPF0172)
LRFVIGSLMVEQIFFESVGFFEIQNEPSTMMDNTEKNKLETRSEERTTTATNAKETMGNDKHSRGNPTVKVVVRPKAFCSMVLHAAKHKNEVVHGILLGSSSSNTPGAAVVAGSKSKTTITGGVVTLTVHDAVPVSHGTPTRPLIETAIGLIEASSSQEAESNNCTIVGWYTAPTLLNDTRPGPIALRMAANFEVKKGVNNATTGGEVQHQPSTLLVLQNAAIGPCLQGKANTAANDVVKALGKDFGDQYLEPIDLVVDNGEAACQAVAQAYKANISCNDLVDHFNGPPSTTPWYPNPELNAFVLVQKDC